MQLIEKLTDNPVAITDESGEFLLRLDDGRVIDTKGWAGWEWTHGIGLYGMYHYYQQTGDEKRWRLSTTGSVSARRKARRPKTSIPFARC